jgi:Uma2 family endonuclease
MAAVPQRKPPRMTIELFRAFYASRPDEEHWELINGVAMMMTPATMAHQRIASNFEHALLEALEIHAPHLTALQAIGVNIAPAIDDYDPEPDVVVVESAAAEEPGGRYANRFYLVAEVVSVSDRVDIESKCAVYKLHEACKFIVIFQQDRCDVRIHRRTATGWTEEQLANPDDVLNLPEFGLRCRVADLYRGTPLQPRRPTGR